MIQKSRTATLLIFAACLLCASQTALAQTTVPAWQQAAGGAMSFDVASVRPDDGPFRTPSFSPSADEWFDDPAGRFHATFPVLTYITFAYKIWLTPEEGSTLIETLPGWVKSQRFAIDATAPLHTTKDQYRLMMQSLLADRFGLKLHFEGKEKPVLAMVLIKPDQTGPRLIPHSQGQPCDAKPAPDTFPLQCYSNSARPYKDGLWISGSRDTTMDLIGNFISSVAGTADEISRRVVDQTGLTGLWDFTLLAAQPGLPPGQQPPNAPSTLQAIQDQLGIRLKSTRAVVSLPVIDHIERPSDN
jgi:uncharacterized protein (TIGR03435 family)